MITSPLQLPSPFRIGHTYTESSMPPGYCSDLVLSMGPVWLASSGILRHVALVRTDVSEELSGSIIRVTRIGELVTILAITSNLQLASFAS
jgi:hypothetical protein